MYNYLPVSIYEAPPFPDVTFSVSEKHQISTKSNTYTQKVVKVFMAIGILFLLISYGPSLLYVLFGSGKISDLLSSTTTVNALNKGIEASNWQPPFDKNLPTTNVLFIPSVNIKTEIHEAKSENHEDALREGVWRVNDFGTPYDRQGPTILTAHRYGYLDWSLSFRLNESFYNLPNLKVGDTLSITWRQRKYNYAVYKSEEGTEITDYSADLILYTCRDLTSDIREIKYARLIEI